MEESILVQVMRDRREWACGVRNDKRGVWGWVIGIILIVGVLWVGYGHGLGSILSHILR